MVGRLRGFGGLVTALSLVLSAASCGRGGEEQTTATTGLDGLVGDELAVAATSAGGGAVVVEGGASSEQGPRPVVWWVPAVGEEPLRQPLPHDQALFNVDVWWTGTEVAIVGLSCPRWTSATEPPDLGDGTRTMAELCGNDRYTVGLWDPEEQEWRVMEETGLRADDGLFIKDASGPRALISAVEVGTETAPPTRTSALAVIDTESGGLTVLPAAPITANDAVSVFTPCLSSRGPSGLLVWEEAEPPGVAEGRWDRALAAEATPYPNPPQHLLAFEVQGDAWVPVQAHGESSGAAVSPVCADDGVIVSGLSEASIASIGGITEWRSLGSLPHGGAATTVNAQDGSGPPLAISLQDPPEEEPPDDARSSPAWMLSGAEWVSVGDVPYTDRWRGVVLGDAVISLVSSTGTTTQGAARVVVP